MAASTSKCKGDHIKEGKSPDMEKIFVGLSVLHYYLWRPFFVHIFQQQEYRNTIRIMQVGWRLSKVNSCTYLRDKKEGLPAPFCIFLTLHIFRAMPGQIWGPRTSLPCIKQLWPEFCIKDVLQDRKVERCYRTSLSILLKNWSQIVKPWNLHSGNVPNS